MIEVFARRPNEAEATEFVDRLLAESKVARLGNSRYFRAHELHRDVTHVYHDGEVALIPWACEERGIPCSIIPGFEGETRHEAYQPTADHHVVKAGSWYKLMGPDGQVGKSTRSEAEAWAQLGAGD